MPRITVYENVVWVGKGLHSFIAPENLNVWLPWQKICAGYDSRWECCVLYVQYVYSIISAEIGPCLITRGSLWKKIKRTQETLIVRFIWVLAESQHCSILLSGPVVEIEEFPLRSWVLLWVISSINRICFASSYFEHMAIVDVWMCVVGTVSVTLNVTACVLSVLFFLKLLSTESLGQSCSLTRRIIMSYA